MEQQSFRNSISGVGQPHQNQSYYPFSYVMVNEDGQQEQHHYNTYHHMSNQCLLSPPTTVPSMALPPFISSSLPESYTYFTHHPSTTIAHTPQQQLRPQTFTMDNTVQHCHQRVRCNGSR